MDSSSEEELIFGVIKDFPMNENDYRGEMNLLVTLIFLYNYIISWISSRAWNTEVTLLLVSKWSIRFCPPRIICLNCISLILSCWRLFFSAYIFLPSSETINLEWLDSYTSLVYFYNTSCPYLVPNKKLSFYFKLAIWSVFYFWISSSYFYSCSSFIFLSFSASAMVRTNSLEIML